jgi:predicted Zn-dependent protease
LILAAALGAGGSFLALSNRADDHIFVAKAPSAAAARALGARWRAVKTETLGRDYAQALIAAGLYDELLSELTTHGLLAGDREAATLYRAEATLRQGRYAEALAAAGNGEANPYLSYARARAAYALTADPQSAAEDLSRALRGPEALAADAWLFRARLALDENDLDAAEAAARRANEAGGDKWRADAVFVEKAIRSNELASAASRLKARAKRRRGAQPADDYRLAAMIALRHGYARAGASLIDDARRAGGDDNHKRLLAALAKWQAGDIAQAWSLVDEQLAVAPTDWMALDLGAGIALASGRTEEAQDLLGRLKKERAALAIFRRFDHAADGAALDGAYEALLTVDDDLSGGGVIAALLGDGAPGPSTVREPDEKARQISALALALNKNDTRKMRLGANRLAAQGEPLAQTLAGAAFIKLGDDAGANRALTAASAAAPDFFAPVARRAASLAGRGDVEAAASALQVFLNRHDSDARALMQLAALEAKSGDDAGAVASFEKISPSVLFADDDAAMLYAAAARNSGPNATRIMLDAARDGAATAKIFGRISLAAGDDEGAAAAFRRALIGDPADTDLPVLYLEAMTRLGRAEEAQSLLSEIVRRRADAAPNSAQAVEILSADAGFTVKIRQ